MMRSRRVDIGWLLVIVLFLMSSCIDEITLDVDNDVQFIVINGVVSDTPGEYFVEVNNSPIIGVGNDNILVPINDAQVRFLDNENNVVVFEAVEDEEGTYRGFVDGIDPSRLYHIEVQLSDGNVIESEPQRLPELSIPIETIEWDVIQVESINDSGNVIGRDFVEVYANTAPTNEEAFLRWRVTGEYEIVERAFGLFFPRHCYVKQNIDFNRVTLADTRDFVNGTIVQEPLVRLPIDSRFNILYLFNVSQFTISQQEHEYWSRIDQLIDVEGTLFDPPPGVLRGNLFSVTSSNQNVQGYFSLARQSFNRRFVNIGEKGFFADTDCQSRPGANNPAKCLDCTTLLRSTLVKPPYWPF